MTSSIPSSASGSQSRRLLFVLGPFLVLAFVFVLFVLLLLGRDMANHNGWGSLSAFVSIENFKKMFSQTVIIGICALGMTMIIVSGGIDLSVGSVVALTSVVGALMIREGAGLGWALLLPIVTGGLVGAINGTLIGYFRMVPFIVTLGILGAARGAAKWLGGTQSVNFPPSPIAYLMRDPDPTGLNPSWGLVVAIILAAAMSVVMRRTVFGRHVFALGSSEATARLCGIRVERLKLLIYSVAGFFFGLAGLCQLSRLRQGDPTSANMLELDTIAAVVIGGASLSGGTGSILGSITGALTMAVLRTGSQYMDWPSYMQEIIIGLLIIVAVALDKFRQRENG